METSARRTTSPSHLLDRPMVTLHDEIRGVAFSIWVPSGAHRTTGASSELALELDDGGDRLDLIVVLVRRPELRTMAHQVSYLATIGEEIHRASSLVDGYLVTAIGCTDVNVVRHLRLPDVALQCWATVRLRSDNLAAQIVWAEAICSSLAVRPMLS